MKEILNNLKDEKYNNVIDFTNRLNAKIKILGNNYIEMLNEQMARYQEL